MVGVEYKKDSDFWEIDPKVNVYLASFITSQARLKLLEIMELVGESAIYQDTDSLYWIHKEGVARPVTPTVPQGLFLGQLVDELTCSSSGCRYAKTGNCPKDRHYIKEWVCTAPKVYSYITDCNKVVSKVKGFTLHEENLKKINFESLKQIVTEDRTLKIQTNNPFGRIGRRKWETKLMSETDKKCFKFVYTKRVMLEDYKTVPYGTFRP